MQERRANAKRKCNTRMQSARAKCKCEVQHAICEQYNSERQSTIVKSESADANANGTIKRYAESGTEQEVQKQERASECERESTCTTNENQRTCTLARPKSSLIESEQLQQNQKYE